MNLKNRTIAIFKRLKAISIKSLSTTKQTVRLAANIIYNIATLQRMFMRNIYEIECIGRDGQLKWTARVCNLVVNTGLDDILDKYWKGSAYTAAHYVLLTDGTPTVAAGDTMASHVGWAEVVAYSESVRQTLTMGTVSGQSVDNSASKAVFSINGTTTVGGIGISTDSTKSGTSGTLVAAGAFTGGDKSVASGDTLNVTVTSTQASA